MCVRPYRVSFWTFPKPDLRRVYRSPHPVPDNSAGGHPTMEARQQGSVPVAAEAVPEATPASPHHRPMLVVFPYLGHPLGHPLSCLALLGIPVDTRSANLVWVDGSIGVAVAVVFTVAVALALLLCPHQENQTPGSSRAQSSMTLLPLSLEFVIHASHAPETFSSAKRPHAHQNQVRMASAVARRPTSERHNR